jgi:hypothetical protein
MTVEDKIIQINEIVKEIDAEDPVVGRILLEGFGLSLNIIKTMILNDGKRVYDYSEQLQIISEFLGFSLEDLVTKILEQKSQEFGEASKQADAETLKFITDKSDLDDYEQFIAKNSAKESLDFLSKEL